ncbi:MAG TPA: hypothetical protein VKR31_00845 [Rhizomicrobium sp.]|nr:hypothetical protein [Rhizomicrobium sp.]
MRKSRRRRPHGGTGRRRADATTPLCLALPKPNRKAIDDGHPCITIAGQEWPIPPLAPRQNRHVVAALMRMGGDFFAHYGDLVDAVFFALTRAHPDLARSEFEEWPIPVYELTAALPVITKQTGWLKPGKNSTTEPKPPDFDAIIAEVCNFRLGTTEEYWEDNLTGARFEAMAEEWRQRPPLVTLISAFLGYKPPPTEEEAISELFRLFPSGKISGSPTMH